MGSCSQGAFEVGAFTERRPRETPSGRSRGHGPGLCAAERCPRRRCDDGCGTNASPGVRRSPLPCPPRRPFLSLSLLSAASHARGSRCPRLSTHPPWSCSLLLILRPVAQASLPQKVFLEEDNDKDNKSQGRLLFSGYQVPRTILDAEAAAGHKKVKSFPLRVTFQGERNDKQTNK